MNIEKPQALSTQASPLNGIPLAAEPAKVWVLLWSQSQNALHVEPLTDMLNTNHDAFLEDRRMDYVPLCLGKRDSVDTAARAIRQLLHERAERRSAASPEVAH